MIALAVAPEKGMRADWFFVVGKPIGFSFWGIKKMNEIATEKTVTTKELAEMLGVDVDTVNNTVNRLGFSDVLRKSTGGRPTRVFNEKQATLIKQAIQRHHNLATRQIDNISTDLEGELLVQKAMAYQQMKINQLQAKVKEMLTKIMDDKNAPINNLLNRNYILEILETNGTAFKRPWFGQLMTGPQLMAYLCQVNMWLEKYKPEILL